MTASVFDAHYDQSDKGWYKQQHFVCNQEADLTTVKAASVPVTATGFIGVMMRFASIATLASVVADLLQRRNLKVQLHSRTAQSVVLYTCQDRARNADVRLINDSNSKEFPQMSIEELSNFSSVTAGSMIEKWLQSNTEEGKLPDARTNSVMSLTGQAMSSRKVQLKAGTPANIRLRHHPRILIQFDKGTTASAVSGMAFATWGYAKFNNLNQAIDKQASSTKVSDSLTAVGGVINTLLQVGAPLLELLKKTDGLKSTIVQTYTGSSPQVRYTDLDDIPADLSRQIQLAASSMEMANDAAGFAAANRNRQGNRKRKARKSGPASGKPKRLQK